MGKKNDGLKKPSAKKKMTPMKELILLIPLLLGDSGIINCASIGMQNYTFFRLVKIKIHLFLHCE